MALPKPCNTREEISHTPDVDTATSKQDTVKTAIPKVKILFRPYISAKRPKGTIKTAAVRRNEVATQLRFTASSENSDAIEGKAMFTEEPMNGVKKELNVATSNAALRIALVESSTFISDCTFKTFPGLFHIDQFISY